jgi:pimeloyl-ACP methyl ester carboxylesterase
VPSVALADIDMYYESHGAGAPLLLIGGLSQTIEDVRPLIDELAPHFRVIAVENRGSGRTSAPAGPYSMAQMARDVRALMDELQLERAHALGISMGGRVALALALDSPERVDRLVLVSTSARVAGARLRAGGWVSLMLFQLRYRAGPSGQPRHAQRAQYWAGIRFDCTDRLRRITQPAIVVHGRSDVVVPLSGGEELHRGITGARLVVLDGGHRISIDRDSLAQVCAAIVPFLDGAQV